MVCQRFRDYHKEPIGMKPLAVVQINKLWMEVCFCSNLRYSWVTCLTSSNFFNFSQLILSTHLLFLYQFLTPYQTFIVLSIFCHFLTPCYLFNFYFMYAPYKGTCCTHHKHINSLSCLIGRTLSAPIHHSNSPGVFGHRAILTMGGSDRG